MNIASFFAIFRVFSVIFRHFFASFWSHLGVIGFFFFFPRRSLIVFPTPSFSTPFINQFLIIFHDFCIIFASFPIVFRHFSPIFRHFFASFHVVSWRHFLFFTVSLFNRSHPLSFPTPFLNQFLIISPPFLYHFRLISHHFPSFFAFFRPFFAFRVILFYLGVISSRHLSIVF
jgi:hypothetical protein